MGNWYIEIKLKNKRERLIIDKVMKRAPCIAGWATTFWRAYREGDKSRTPLVVNRIITLTAFLLILTSTIPPNRH
ncbi:hypothetical protein P154DRAFT_101114 [Amniculicola lignicola CBS 123094]|uniref:Uncharacterized protein n=1 Tax=Amniculicola lignicola CBS 123094 TaxID=1392246 RepID=A0A6A5X0A3_9PLEO|nr:hypothetical protein P154DRAFT_101114 [Amniculicola lignicola CBS 123094]